MQFLAAAKISGFLRVLPSPALAAAADLVHGQVAPRARVAVGPALAPRPALAAHSCWHHVSAAAPCGLATFSLKSGALPMSQACPAPFPTTRQRGCRRGHPPANPGSWVQFEHHPSRRAWQPQPSAQPRRHGQHLARGVAQTASGARTSAAPLHHNPSSRAHRPRRPRRGGRRRSSECVCVCVRACVCHCVCHSACVRACVRACRRGATCAQEGEECVHAGEERAGELTLGSFRRCCRRRCCCCCCVWMRGHVNVSMCRCVNVSMCGCA